MEPCHPFANAILHPSLPLASSSPSKKTNLIASLLLSTLLLVLLKCRPVFLHPLHFSAIHYPLLKIALLHHALNQLIIITTARHHFPEFGAERPELNAKPANQSVPNDLLLPLPLPELQQRRIHRYPKQMQRPLLASRKSSQHIPSHPPPSTTMPNSANDPTS